MEFSHFFGSSCRDNSTPEFVSSFTELIVPEQNEDGSISMVTKVLEMQQNQYSALKFSDFSINEMLRSGVSPKSIKCSIDKRLGSDKEIKSFMDRVDSIAETLFTNN